MIVSRKWHVGKQVFLSLPLEKEEMGIFINRCWPRDYLYFNGNFFFSFEQIFNNGREKGENPTLLE